MMKINTLLSIILLTFISLNIDAQTDSLNRGESTYDNYIKQKGLRIKFVDKQLSKIHYGISTSSKLTCNLRTLIDKDGNKYFVVLSDGVNRNIIEYSDLISINNELDKLLKEFAIDSTQNPDYLENMYISNDRFMVGYYIEGKKNKWLIRLYRGVYKQYGSHEVYKIEKLSEGLKTIQNEIESIIQKQ